jgi:hypothetical protein
MVVVLKSVYFLFLYFEIFKSYENFNGEKSKK